VRTVADPGGVPRGAAP